MLQSLSRVAAGWLVVLLLVSIGCESNQLQSKYDQLYLDHQQLQEEHAHAQTNRDASHADRTNLSSEVTRLRGDLDRALVPAGAPPVIAAAPAPARLTHFAANTAFNAIEGIETFVTPGQITVRVPGSVLFSSGKVTLRDSARKMLDKIARVIKSDYPDKTVRIEGYTDRDPIKKSQWADNLELSLQRAAAVHRFLQKQGVNAGHMYAAGFGEARPRPSKSKSRRVEIVVVLSE
jgi:chemotaxis protein MotB